MKAEPLTTSMTDSQFGSLPWLRMAMLLLCLSVFAWGLRYKLSLYQDAAQFHPSTVAKLMQGEQKHWTAALRGEWTQSEPPRFPAHWIVLPVHSPLPTQRSPMIVEPVVAPFISRAMYLPFFRPPPQGL